MTKKPKEPRAIDDDSRSIPEKLQQVLRLDANRPQNIDTKTPETPYSNSDKKKRKAILPDSIDSDYSDVEGEIKKLKRDIGHALESAKNSNLDQENKKRKRIQVEAEYEERKYGEMDLDMKKVDVEKGKFGKKRKKLDSEEDLLVSKEGFDDEEKLLRTIFVKNFPLKVKKKTLLREFGHFGEIESIRIQSIPLSNDKTLRTARIKEQLNEAVDRVNAYIVFESEESTQASLSHNMVGGNHIYVNKVCPPQKKLKEENAPLHDSKRTVFISNLPVDVKDEELYQLFTGISIETIQVVREPATSMGNCTAYVLFKTLSCRKQLKRLLENIS